ncbi:T9SS type B sorting domain-containing protein [Flammeovirga pectinis]|uniref:T9SS type B sorting domain-containing protein n=1 Tax=Flammeovirga pectinis TaxID=2494373 RepID=A0A3Q9FN29_9BACT|nr:PKD domain-containing protein [Flammeovirga pectinis]AZQ62018.1 T9SS type B sorting domain-containing protein [Flammeovirga pectinis]
MTKSLLRSLLFIVTCTLTLLANRLHGQDLVRTSSGINYDTTQVIQGCEGVAIQFSIDGPDTYSNFNWSTDYNGNTYTIAEPFEQFNAFGNYSITVTFDDSGGTSYTRTVTNKIVVYDQPEGSFYASSTNACIGDTITLIQTTPGTFSALDFLVDNKLYTVTNDSAKIVLNNYGDFDVVLSGITSDGCSFIKRENNYIHIETPFTTSLSIDQAISCATSQAVLFTATSTDSDGNNVSPTYYWNFGDSNYDTTLTNTSSHTYNISDGTDFTATVSTISNNCAGTTSNTVDFFFKDISTLYTTSIVSTCNTYEVTYTPNTIDPLLTSTTLTWDFDDGSPTASHPISDVIVHSFANTNPTPFTANVSATINEINGNSCMYSDAQLIPVLPQAGINVVTNNTRYCSANFDVETQAINLQNVTNFYWVVDGGTPEGNNKTTDTLSISGYGTHTIELFFDAQTGDLSDNCALNSIVVYSAPLDITLTGPQFDCDPSNETFTASETWEDESGNIINNPFTVQTESWSILNTVTSTIVTENGNPMTLSNLPHGTYQITRNIDLTPIGNNSSCSFSSIAYDYVVGERLDNPTIQYAPSVICIGTTVNFNTTTAADTAGLGLSGDYPIIYQYRYASNLDWVTVGTSGIGAYYYGDIVDDNRTSLPGTFTVELRAIINGCGGMPSSQTIRIEPSEAEHELTVDECNPTILGFTNNSLGTTDTDYQWTLTIDPPGPSNTVNYTSPITKDENYNFLADTNFPTFTGYTQGEIPEASSIYAVITATEPSVGCSDTEDTTIVMPNALPILNPTPQTSVGTCVNNTLAFDAGDGNIGSSYNWVFTLDTDPSITFSFGSNTSLVNTNFPIPGNYNGTVTVATNAGCLQTASVGPIQITGGSVQISGNATACVGDPQTFQGTNLMYSPLQPNYEWFVDGVSQSSGTTQLVGGNYLVPDLTNIIFNAPNSPQNLAHTITLSLEVNGCTASYTHDITVTKPIVSFANPITDYITFDYVCDEIITQIDLDLDTDDIYNLTTSTVNYFMGGVGGTSVVSNTQIDDQATFSLSAGTYTLTVQVIDENGCSSDDDITFTVPTMQELEARFTPNTVNLVCPGFVSFSDLADDSAGNTIRRDDLDGLNLFFVDIQTWEWDFDGDGTIDATTTDGSATNYYDSPGSYDAILTVTDAHGCQDTSTPITIVVGGTSGTYEILKKISFEPATTTLVAFPLDDPNTDITNTIYQWSSGDGQAGMDSANIFQYMSEGTFTPSLTFIDENGCNYPADFSGDMRVLSCPDISASDITLCTDAGTYTLNVTDMSWSSSFSTTDTIETATYIYSWELSYQWYVDGVLVSAINGGENPEVTFNFAPIDTAPFTINPDDADGKLYTIQATIMTSYVDKIDASNNITNTAECVSSDNIRVIYNPTPVPSFTNDEVCGNSPTTLDATLSDFGLFTRGVITNYEWDIDNDGTYDFNSANPISTYTFPSQGVYPVTLRTTSADGCFATFSLDSVIVNSIPNANFTYQNVCESFEASFDDLSTITPVTDDKIVRWDWDFNNNGTFDFGGTDSLIHRYPSINFNTQLDGNGTIIGTNQVITTRLVVTTNKGCTHEFIPSSDSTLIFQFKNPDAALSAERQIDALANEVCLGQTFQFRDISTVDNSNISAYIGDGTLPANVNDIIAWYWDFNDGNFSTLADPSHDFTSVGTYNVKLMVTTARGCNNIDSLTVYVRENPDSEIGSDSIIVCNDTPVTLRPIANDSTGFDYLWTRLNGPVNGTTSFTDTTLHTVTVSAQESDYNTGEARIDIKYQLQIEDTNHPTLCLTYDTVDVEIHRLPIINLDTTLISCGTSALYTALPFGSEIISGFSTTWTQVYLNGGAIDTTELNIQDLTINPTSYLSGSTRIQSKYYVDVENEIGCTDQDSITFEFYRRPDFSSWVDTTEQCNSSDRSTYEVDFYPFGETEVLPHNSSYDYTWSMSSNAADHNLDALNVTDLVNQVVANQNNQNINLVLTEDYFVDNTTSLSFELSLHVENSFDNTCLKDTTVIFEVERRPRELNLLDTRIDVCDSVVVLNHHTETLDFNYSWRNITSGNSSSYNGSSIPDTYGQLRTLSFSDSDYATGASQFTIRMNNRVRKKELDGTDANPACGINRNLDLVFYRTPNIQFTETKTGNNPCASSALLSSGSEVITGFNYQWDLISVQNGTLSEDALVNKDINLAVSSWNTNQTIITAEYRLTVTNSASPTCMDVENYTIQFFRTPEITYTPDVNNCAISDTVTANSEALNGADFLWNQNTISGGSLLTTPTADNTTTTNNQMIIDVDNFTLGQHRIDANYTLTINNSTASTCDDDTTFNITFYRTPQIAFVETRTDSCALVNTLQPFGTETINGYNYQWNQLSVDGGTVSTSTLTNQDLTVTATSFDQDTAYIVARYELFVQNTDANSCVDIDTIEFRFYRTPTLNAFVKNKPFDECGLSVELYPLGQSEIINHNEGFDYTWTLNSITGAGADGNTLPSNINDSISNQVNDQNFNLTMPLSAFESGSNEIVLSLDVLIEHTDNNVTCQTDSTLLLSFKRPPVISLSEIKPDSCDLTSTLQPFGSEVISGFNYNWQVTSITGYDGNDGNPSNNLSVGSAFTTQDLTLTVIDDDFIDTESKIEIILQLDVANSLAASNTSCQDIAVDTITFYRTPEINSAFAFNKIANCDHTGTSEPFSTNVNGFVYVWMPISVSGGGVNHNNLFSREITIDVDSFATNSLQIDGTYRLRVFNSEVPSCFDEEDVNFEFYRTPEIVFNDPLVKCAVKDTSMSFTTANEAFVNAGETFFWNLNSITGGSIDSLNNNNVFIVDVDSFSTDAVQIDLEYQVSITNSSAHTCDDDTTFQVTFYRTPEIDFLSVKADSCSLQDIIKPFNGEDVPLLLRTWRQLSVTGGSITQNSGVNDLDLDISVASFDLNATTIDVTYELTAVNSVSNSCTDKDTITVHFYRTPSFANYSETMPLGFCGDLIYIQPLGTTEIINHNNGFDYQWTLNPATVSGANGGVLIQPILDSINANQNDQNLTLSVGDSAYADGAHILSFEMDLNIAHSNTNIVCAANDTTILYRYIRYPDIDIVESKTDSCDLTSELQPFALETIPGFNYSWRITNISGYDGSTYVVNDTYSTQNTTFTVTDDDFIDNESVIAIQVELTVVNSAATADPTCSNTENYTLYFYRTPTIDSPFDHSKMAECDGNGVASPFPTDINGYTYIWSIDSIRNGVIIDNAALAQRELAVQVDSFTDMESIMYVYYHLRVVNTNQTTCYAEDTVSFKFYRTPEVSLTSLTGICQSSVMVSSTNEMLNDVDFDWTQNSITGGTIVSSPAIPNGSRTATFTANTFNAGESEINANYTITLLNSGESMCDDDTTFNFTLFREPEINLTYARASNDSCDNALTLIPFNSENISGYNNTWSNVSLKGGAITTSTLTDENLTVTVDTFALHSTKIDSRFLLNSFNTNSVGCLDSMSIASTLYRSPDFTNFSEVRNDGSCGLSINFYPLGTNENIAHGSGFDYQWNLNSGGITGAGADGNTLPNDVISDITNQVNNQNIEVTLPITAFASGSNQIEIPFTIQINNTDQVSCSSSLDTTMIFYRPAIIDIQQSLTACGIENIITAFGTEDVSSAFNFNWTFTTIGGSVTNSSLTDHTLTFNNPVFTTGSDTVLVDVSVNVENIENTSCTTDSTFRFYFYREPDITVNQSMTACGSTNLISLFNSETIAGYNYVWDSVQVDGGTLAIGTGYSSSTQNIELNTSSFNSGSHRIDADYRVTAVNYDTLGNQLCSDFEDIQFTIFRVPTMTIAQSLTTGDCGNSNTVTLFGTEIIDGYNYTWNLQSVVGGTVSISSTTDQNVTFDTPVFNTSSNQIDVTYQITAVNADSPTCTSTETVSFTFYRTPNASITDINAECSTGSIVLETTESYVPQFNYTWNLINTTVDNNPNNEALIATQVIQNNNTFTLNSPIDQTSFFPTGSALIQYEYEVIVENSLSTQCIDKDTITASFFRNPILTSTQSLDTTNCQLSNTIRPFATEEITNYRYTWNEVNVLGGTIDTTHLDNHNQDVQFNVVSFDPLSHKIDITYTLDVENELGGCNDSETYTFTFFRTPVVDIQQSLTACGIENIITAFGNEDVSSAFNFNWTFTTIGGSVTNSSLTGHTLTFNNPVFTTGSDTVLVDVSVNVENIENTSCTTDSTFRFYFYREPDITVNQSMTACGSTNLISLFNSETIAGYNYVWDSVQVDGGTLAIGTGYSSSTQNIELNTSSFNSGSHRIDADYRVTAVNYDTLGNQLCSDFEDIQFTIFRVPTMTIAQSLTTGDCGNSNTVTLFGTEIIDGYNYTWNLQSVVGGTVSISSTTDQNVTFDTPVFNTSSNQIDVTYQITAVNADSPTCTSTETVSFTFYRTPNASITDINAECSTGSIVLETTESYVPQFNYTWNLINTTVDNNPNNEALIATQVIQNNNTFTLNSPIDQTSFFPTGSALIQYEYEVIVENSLSTQCIDKDTITASFFRNPILTSTQSLDTTNCQLSNTIRPFATEEITNYRYTWNEVNVLGGTIDTTHLDNHNQDVQFNVVSFDSLSHRIDVTYSLDVENELGGCSDSETYTFTFFRTPNTDLTHLSIPPICEDGTITLFPTEANNSGYTYNWTRVSILTDNGIDLLAANIYPVESSLSTHSITLNHNPSFPANSVRVIAVYELETTNNDNGCTTSDQVTVQFDRDATIGLTSNTLTVCDDTDLILQTVETRPDNYDFTWTIDSIFTDNNASISSLSAINTSNAGQMIIDSDPVDFPLGASLITANFAVHAENKLNADCDADTSYTIQLARKPMINFTDNHTGCALDTVLIKPLGDETINGYNYTWSVANIDGFNGTTNDVINGQTANQNFEIHFEDDDFTNGRSQIEVTMELTIVNPNGSSCTATQQHTLIFFRVPHINFDVVKSANDSCTNLITTSPFNEVISDYQYQWTKISTTNGAVSEVDLTAKDLVTQNPIFNNGETQIDVRYELSIINSNPNASQPCITTQEVDISFFKTPVLNTTLSTSVIGCSDNVSLKALTFPITSSQRDNYIFDWSMSSISGGTIDTLSTYDSLHINVNQFTSGSGEINITLDVDGKNAFQENTCLSNESESITFYRTPNITLNPSATDLCEDQIFSITTGEELVSHFDYNWTITVTDDINLNTGTVDTSSYNTRGHQLELRNPNFPIGASYIEIEATLNVSNGSSGCTDLETTIIRFHKQPTLSLLSSPIVSCETGFITLRPSQNEVTNFNYTWEQLDITSDSDSISNANITETPSGSAYEMNLTSPTFPHGAAQLTARYKLTISNPLNPYCTQVSDSIDVTFFRNPITEIPATVQGSCTQTSITVQPNNEEFINNFNYAWTIDQIDSDITTNDNRGNVSISNTSSYNPDFILNTMPDDASSLTAHLSLSTDNIFNNCGTSTDQSSITFLRTPTVVLPADLGGCQEQVFTITPLDTYWSGMNYSWNIISLSGGRINTQSDFNTNSATLADPIFNSNSHEVVARLVLNVNNKLDTSCNSADTMTVVFHRTPTADFTVDKGFGCQMETIFFSTRNSSTPQDGSIFEWDFNNDGNYEVQSMGDTTSIFSTIGTHTIKLRITTPAGCISPVYSEDIHIYEIPTPSFTVDNICIGELAQFVNTTTQLNQSGDHGIKNVKWDFNYNEDNGALFDAFDRDASFTYTQPGTYKVLVEVTNNGGCTNTYIDSVTVTPLPVITMESDIWICEGLTTTLTPQVNVPVTYSWSNGSTADNILVGPLEETVYSVEVTNEQGCINTHQITVHVVPDVIAEWEQESCDLEPITFDGRIPDYPGVVESFLWSNGETTPTIDVLENGIYTVTTRVQHESGTMCEFVHDFTATFHPNPAQVLQDTTFCFETGDKLDVAAVEGENYTYQWSTGETSRVITRDRSGILTVIVTDESHATRCATVDTINVNQICPARLHSPNAFTPNGDGTNDEFLLEPAYAVDIDFHIYNNWGESIFHKVYTDSFEASTPGNGWDGTYKGAKMMSGSYTYSVRYTSQKDGSVTEKTGQILLIR